MMTRVIVIARCGSALARLRDDRLHEAVQAQRSELLRRHRSSQ
jgi:hypothetical protein